MYIYIYKLYTYHIYIYIYTIIYIYIYFRYLDISIGRFLDIIIMIIPPLKSLVFTNARPCILDV